LGLTPDNSGSTRSMATSTLVVSFTSVFHRRGGGARQPRRPSRFFRLAIPPQVSDLGAAGGRRRSALGGGSDSFVASCDYAGGPVAPAFMRDCRLGVAVWGGCGGVALGSDPLAASCNRRGCNGGLVSRQRSQGLLSGGFGVAGRAGRIHSPRCSCQPQV